MASSQDPGFVPTPYTYDSGVDRQTFIPSAPSPPPPVPFARGPDLGLGATISKEQESISGPLIFTSKGGLSDRENPFLDRTGTVGPHIPTEGNVGLEQHTPGTDALLAQKRKARTMRAEAKDSQRLSKIIKQGAKVEQKALDVAIDELVDLQRFQKQAVKDEAKAYTHRSKVLAAFKKQESAFLSCKSRYETLQAQVNAETERLEAVREGTREANERVAKKSQEVDNLRKIYSVDEREREARLGELKGNESSLRWIHGSKELL